MAIPLGLLFSVVVIRTGLIQVYAPVEASVNGIEPDRVVEYARRGALPLNLHFFLPDDFQVTDSLPAVLFFHGGTWKGGHPKRLYPQCEYLAGKGMVAVSAEYRLMGKGGLSPLDCVEDARAAFDWLAGYSAELGIDSERIVVGGGSAGGHLAACVGLLPTDSDSPHPTAMILFNPPLDLSGEAWPDEFMTPERRTLMALFGGMAQEISPLQYVDSEAPPTILFHGTVDDSVPIAQSIEFDRLMEETGVRCDFHPFEFRGHGFYDPNHGDGQDFLKTMDMVEDFLTSINIIHPDSESEAG
jgi:acetyl esterase/lipase